MMAEGAGTLPPRGARYWDAALRNTVNAAWAIFWHEADMHNGRRLLMGYLAAGLEPLFIVLVLDLLFTMLGRHVPYGRSSLLFLGTGVYPIYMFIHTSIRMRHPLGRGKYRVRFAMERPLMVLFINAIQHYITYMCVIAVFFGSLYFSGIDDAIPFDPLRAFSAITGVYLIGFGAGIINAVFGRLFPAWDLAWPAISRTVLHFSGLYYVAGYLPPTIRYYLLFNPVLHATDWFRMAFYPFFPAASSGAWVVVMSGMTLITIGLLLESNTRQYLEAKE
jgi:capsular polysaccharide transport system permease protein